MDKIDVAQEILLEKLEERDWDMSPQALEEVAHDIENFFANSDAALDFVEANASSLFDMMQAAGEKRMSQEKRRPPLPDEFD